MSEGRPTGKRIRLDRARVRLLKKILHILVVACAAALTMAPYVLAHVGRPLLLSGEGSFTVPLTGKHYTGRYVVPGNTP